MESVLLTQLNNAIKMKKAKKQAIALHLGVSRQQLSRLLNGKSAMNVQQFEMICEFIEVKPAIVIV